MVTDERTKPLEEWNRLERENTENAVVSSMLLATLRISSSLDTFNNWMLIATAAITSFMIANLSEIVEFIGRDGFVYGGYILCLSSVLGLFGKFMGLRCKMTLELSEAVQVTFAEHLQRYKVEEEKIQNGAKFWGISLETGLRLDRILQEYFAPFPKPIRWLAKRHIEKQKENPQIAYLSQIKGLQVQSYSIFFQSLLFIYFFVELFFSIAKI
ncbi:hypothetical protein [Photobacterium kishitanii]|uniref:hypothetical protein n=1 Tax=Photobacterium kishitanii TaxID=318456 RepID=UPI0007F8A9BB|nr:hypothetical protein [Photobacterium kishitanii]OBU28965.1 hypothetical protein AYY23_22490 [Photobacterium kishitanii]PSW47161.1 hypothetical protein C0W66_19915 [Photobacterium kishitanii]